LRFAGELFMVATEKGFRLTRREDRAFLQSPLLEAVGLADHAFSTRLGGCSRGSVASLNTAFHTGDNCENVLENRRRLLEPFGYRPEEIVAGIQVHGSGVTLVTAKDCGKGAAPETFLGETDALATVEPGVLLTAYAADCQLLYFIEPQIPVVALAHAGWRGTLGGMARVVVAYLQKNFAVRPSQILAAVSPGICSRCYRVDEEVAGQFRRAGWGCAPYLEPDQDGRFRLDLSAINTAQLRETGIEECNLAENNWCTSCRPDLFYSYRRDQGVTGRMMGFLVIKPERSRAT
jgi:polyphenol oxidase